MPTATYDGRSFMLDGKRVWLVSGSIHYARVPHEYWEDRIHAAKAAGLNTIETPVFWNRHEPRPGHFDFKGDNDLRRFVTLIGQAGLYCILRPGPYIGQGWDLGGLPPWLPGVKGIKLRMSNGPYLEACSRYITAIANQVRDLQVTSPKPGPIILVQNEEAWTCGDDAAATAYLGELGRYLREAGLTVPTINSNNLWQGVEGEIDCWTGSGDLLGTVRQLGAVRPAQPRVVIEFGTGGPGIWGVDTPPSPDAAALEQQIAQILVAGGQFNLTPFHGGTNFGFWGGLLPEMPGGYVTASNDQGAPLRETGEPGPNYSAVRRICTFASRFGRLLANLDPAFQPVVITPNTEPADVSAGRAPKASKATVSGPIVAHAAGPQGSVAFIFSAPGTPESGGKVRLLLPDGGVLPVDTGGVPVSWCLFDTYLSGRAKLDYCGLSAFASVGKTLVLFGPAGADGHLSVNGSPLQVTVPKGKTAAVIEHEGVTLVVCSREQIENVFATDDAVYIGIAGLTHAGQPLALHGEKKVTCISAEGQTQQVPAAAPPARRSAERATLSEWSSAGVTDYCDGSSARYAAIDGAADLSSLGSPFGYGWYRLRVKGAGGRLRLALPRAADRLHVTIDGEALGVIGSGPGAESELSATLRRGQSTIVVLAENLGRVSGGVHLGEAKGVYGDLWDIKPQRVGKGSIKIGEPVEILTFRTPIWGVQRGDLTPPGRLTWTIAHRKKTPILVSVGPWPGRGLLLVNNKAVAYLERGGGERHLLEPEQLKAGVNTIQVALIPDHGEGESLGEQALDALAGAVSFYDCVTNVSAKAEWAFARWEPPRASAFAKSRSAPSRSGCPSWWRASFRGGHGTPLFLDATGLTKGQVYLNGRHVCRYFVATGDGKAVPPQQLYYLPEPWLVAEGDNELLIFDEHGGNPARCRLVHAE
jgi:beta-galactosidase